MNKKKEGKITLGMLKGKPVTTSVPSISIKFHANAEQLEELYASDEERPTNNESLGSASVPSNTGVSEQESSPLKYLPRLVKRSTSIDITPTTTIDASPPSDPWRFFSDIKGKITKSVEDKITEIKSRNQEEGSPLKGRGVKDSKDNSSVSDSEDLSESSISKTCGIVSTTEGAEMSSDEDTPSIEKDKKTEDRARAGSSGGGGLRHRFRLLKPKSTREGVINRTALVRLYNINTDKIEQALPEESEIESAVDALEDTNFQEEKDVLKAVEEEFDNVKVEPDEMLVFKEVQGNELPGTDGGGVSRTVFAPVGFVDMRAPPASAQRTTLAPVFVIAASVMMYFLLYKYSSYLAGFMVGVLVTFVVYYVKSLLDSSVHTPHPIPKVQDILEIPAVHEFQPFTKYEGWVNEFPDVYNPHTYHISQTQSVFLRLQGNLLRLSHTRSKVPKRALWNEQKIKPVFTHHRVYNLLGGKVTLLPEGLAKKRHWSKKYPICVTLSKDQMHFEAPVVTSSTSTHHDDDEETASAAEKQTKAASQEAKKQKKTFGFVKKKKYQQVLAQRFSKLTEENEEYEMDSDNSRASTPSPPSPDFSEDNLALGVDDVTNQIVKKELDDNLQRAHEDFDDDFDALPDDWGTFTPPEDSPTETRLYLFGRTDREKEDWFRRLAAATHKGASALYQHHLNTDESVSSTLIDAFVTEMDYIKFMMIYNKTGGGKKQKSDSPDEEAAAPPTPDIQWINAFVGRILFDCLREDSFTERIRDKIQRKLGSIKLPYFIEELLVTELSLGHTPPLIHRATKPVLDERGLWVDLDITYEGEVMLILQTKLNLMKLKHPHANVDYLTIENDAADSSSRNTDRPAMFNSDVEDSAESTSDEEPVGLVHGQTGSSSSGGQAVLDANGVPVQGLGGTSNTSKKFMKMVDRIAESKFFQAATEYRYIKKAMEGVSNTDLRLRVEVKELVGTLVLNIPPPPTDRVWVGFRPIPELGLSAQPIVGERNITFLRIISWIEKKLIQEFQKLLVIPNMEDFIIPVMSPRLPR